MAEKSKITGKKSLVQEEKKHEHRNPFKFLDYYTVKDTNIFFGRKKEISQLLKIIDKSKITLVYGSSGCGKSSLIQCGLVSELIKKGLKPLIIRRGIDITQSAIFTFYTELETTKESDVTVKKFLEDFNKKISEEGKDDKSGFKIITKTPTFEENSLVNALEKYYTEKNSPIYLIFDQFEELFVSGNTEEKINFIEQLKTVIQTKIPVHFILVIREEYWSELYDFEKQITGFLENRFRLEKVTLSHAQSIVKEMLKAGGYKMEVEFSLKLAEVVAGGKNTIEFPYLQVYLDRIYQLKNTNDSANIQFQNADIETIGNIKDVLGNFLESQLDKVPNRKTAETLLKTFITKEGTRRFMRKKDIHYFSKALGNEISPEEVEYYIHHFVSISILKEKNEYGEYEFMHDSIAEKIFQKLSEQEKELYEMDQALVNGLTYYRKKGLLLREEELKWMEPFEEKLAKHTDFKDLLEKSKRGIKVRSRNRKILGSVVALIITGFALTTVLYFTQAEKFKAKVAELTERVKEQVNQILKFKDEIKQKIAVIGEKERVIVEKQGQIEQLKTALEAKEKLVILNRQIAVEQKSLAVKNEKLAKENHQKYLEAVETAESALKEAREKEAEVMRLKTASNLPKYQNLFNVNAITKSSELAIRAVVKIQDDPVVSYRLAETAYELFQSDISTQALVSAYNSPAFRRCAIDIRKSKMLIISEDALSSIRIEACFSPDGNNLIVPTEAYTASVVNLEGERVMDLKGNEVVVLNGKFSRDGNKILTIYNDKLGRLWNKQGELIAVMKGHKNYLTYSDFSCSNLIVTASWDKTARIWDTTGVTKTILKGHTEMVRKAIFSGDGTIVLTGSFDNTVRLWDLKGNERLQVKLPDEKFIDAEFVPLLDRFIVVSDKFSRIFDYTGNVLNEYPNSVLKFSANGKAFINIFRDRILYSDEKGSTRNIARGNTEWIMGADISPDGNYIATRAYNIAKVWDIRKERELLVLNGHTKKIEEIRFSPDSKHVVTTSLDGTARIWLIDPDMIIKKINEQETSAKIRHLTPVEKELYGI